MKCRRPGFVDLRDAGGNGTPEERPCLPDSLTDVLSGKVIPFSNRDYIRQKVLRLLIEEKGYPRPALTQDRQISFEVDERPVCSAVDISVTVDGKTAMIWKCASGSLVSRHRQVLAAARLLEDRVIPFAAVTNGKGVDMIDTSNAAVIASGFESLPTYTQLSDWTGKAVFRPVNRKKLIYEQRILSTYDWISCQVNS